MAEQSPIARQLKTFGGVVLTWSIVAAVLAVLFGLNTTVGLVMQPSFTPAGTGPGSQQFQMTQQLSQTITYVLMGLSMAWTLLLAIIGFRLGPALGRWEPVRRWAIVWCVANLVVCPFGTGIGIWGLILLMKPEARELLEGGALPVGVER